MPKPPPPRIHLQYPQPAVDGGASQPSARSATCVEVSCDAFRDGHEKLRVIVLSRPAGARKWAEHELHALDAHHNGVRWGGSFVADKQGRWEFTFAAWTDVFATWRDELRRKLEAGETELAGELSEGVVLLKDAATRAKNADKKLIGHALRVLEDADILEAAKHDAAMGHELYAAVERTAERHGYAELEPPLPLEVDRERGPLRLLVRGLPPLMGRPEGRRGAGAAALGDGLRRRLPHADPPDRPHEPQGPQQHARGRRGRPRLALRGRRRRGRARRRAPGHRDGRGRPRAVRHRARPRHGRLPRLRHQRLGRPPVARGASRSGSTAAPTARSSTPRTRPRSTRTSTTSTGSPRTGAASGRSGAGSSCSGSSRA